MTSIIVSKRSLVLPQGSRGGLALPQGQRGFMVVNPSRFGGGTPAVTWNPADCSSAITLSSGSLVARKTSGGGAWVSVRATLARSTGKRYFEVLVTGGGGTGLDLMIGLSDSAMAVATQYSGQTAGSYGYYKLNGNKYNSATAAAFGSAYTEGDIIGIATDLSAGKLWWAKNNVWPGSGDPAAGANAAFTGLSGSLFPAVSFFQDSIVTGRFKASSFTYTPPTGFSSWE
jgi:hypothetical protein